MLVTVYTHKGIDIKIKSPATADEVGYVIDHKEFEGCQYNLIQDAIDAINSLAFKLSQN